MSLWTIASGTHVCKMWMLGKCSTRCHIEMWSLGCLPKSGQYILYDGYIYWVIDYLIEKLQATTWDTSWDLLMHKVSKTLYCYIVPCSYFALL